MLLSTIVAGNTARGVAEDLADNDSGDGKFQLGFDLIQAPGTAVINETPTGSNITGTDPQLGPPATNGGPTQTLLPALTSPVVDAGISNGTITDQRLLLRTSDLSVTANRTGSDGTDIGAVEVQGASCQGAVVFADFLATDRDDALNGTDGPDSIAALAGNDTADGLGGVDCVAGDDGSDDVKGGADDDLVTGGGGNDTASGQSGNDTVEGDAGKDSLSGGGGKDKVIGGDGNDQVKGGGGADTLKGNAGKDAIKARGGGKDKVNCGGGKDEVTVDAKDKVSKNCEKVSGG